MMLKALLTASQGLVFCSCSVIEPTSELVKPRSVVNNFSRDIWLHIGEFLVLPHRSIGFLNRTTKDAFFDYHPLNKSLALYFGIPELAEIKEIDEVLYWLNLKAPMFKKNGDLLKRAITTGIMIHQAFPSSQLKLMRYGIDPIESNFEDWGKLLYENGDYVKLFQLLELLPERFGSFLISLKNIQLGVDLVKMIHSSEPGLYTLLLKESFRNAENNFENVTATIRVILCSLLSGIPAEEWTSYVSTSPAILGNFLSIFNGFNSDLIEAEKERIFGTILGLLDDIPESLRMRFIEFARICNGIRFGPISTELNVEGLDTPQMRLLTSIAISAGKSDLVAKLMQQCAVYNREVLEIILAFGNSHNCNFIYLFNLPLHVPPELRPLILKSLAFKMKSLSFYYISDVVIGTENGMRMTFKKRPGIESYSIPAELIFDIEGSEMGSIHFSFENQFSFKCEERSIIDHLPEILRAIANYQTFQSGELHREPVLGYKELIEAISGSEELMALSLAVGLRFICDNEDLAALFKTPLTEPMKQLLDVRNEHICTLIPHLYTDTQFKNLELFLNQGIHKIFFRCGPPAYTLENYQRYRILLRYWLRSPHRPALQQGECVLFARQLEEEEEPYMDMPATPIGEINGEII